MYSMYVNIGIHTVSLLAGVQALNRWGREIGKREARRATKRKTVGLPVRT
jgi:hypothetical protein